MQKLTFEILNKSVRVEIDGNDPRDIIPAVAFWLSLPDLCPVCKSKLVFEYTTPQTYKYYKLRCIGPVPHCVNLSQRSNDPGAFYLDKSKPWEIFAPAASDVAQHSTDDPGPATPQTAAPDPAEIIQQIKQLQAAGIDKGVTFDRVPFADLASKSIDQLRGIRTYMSNILTREVAKRAGKNG